MNGSQESPSDDTHVVVAAVVDVHSPLVQAVVYSIRSARHVPHESPSRSSLSPSVLTELDAIGPEKMPANEDERESERTYPEKL